MFGYHKSITDTRLGYSVDSGATDLLLLQVSVNWIHAKSLHLDHLIQCSVESDKSACFLRELSHPDHFSPLTSLLLVVFAFTLHHYKAGRKHKHPYRAKFIKS